MNPAAVQQTLLRKPWLLLLFLLLLLQLLLLLLMLQPLLRLWVLLL